MLEDISIKDFALIDSVTVEFQSGFTVLSGETGAGKSLLIGALTFLLGGKAGVELIRRGAHETSVSGTFFLGSAPENADCGLETEPASAYEWLSQHGIEADDGRILLRRVIRENGKSFAWIGGTAVTRADLASFSSFLIDIHGQHEHQSLMKVGEHRKFLDSYAGLTERVRDFTKLYAQLVEKKQVLAAMRSEEAERGQRMELLQFAVKEISEAKLKDGEDVELDEEEKKLSSFEKLYTDVDEIHRLLSGGEGGNSAVSVLKKARNTAESAAEADKSLESLSKRMDTVFYELSDISEEYKSYLHDLVFDPERLAQVQERQTLIYNLKKKYASSVSAPISEVIAYCGTAGAALESLTEHSEKKQALAEEIAELGKRVYREAKEISNGRKSAAEKLAAGVVSVLEKLGMGGTQFSVSVSEKSGTDAMQNCGPYGLDDIEFMICANPGQPLQPLAKIASGGELSRVMLSLKTILAQSDSVGTMIFDEIDTGIGGEVAVSIGSHLKKLAENRQVLCITHLASIAVYADNQIRIKKQVGDGVTQTMVSSVCGDERVSEIARMLSGDAASSESLDHARSLLEKFSGVV